GDRAREPPARRRQPHRDLHRPGQRHRRRLDRGDPGPAPGLGRPPSRAPLRQAGRRLLRRRPLDLAAGAPGVDGFLPFKQEHECMTQAFPELLFIFEMANNHQGDVEHGLRIISEMGQIAGRYGVRAAVKLQYRQLDTFIHPDYVTRTDLKHIPRFLQTRLAAREFRRLVTAIRHAGLLAVVTPFDEPSVELALEHEVDILKVASCSALDWPLLEAMAVAGRPLICSTGGKSIHDVDKIVSFFDHRYVKDLALLHCVGLYPTPNAQVQMRFMQ